MPICGHSIKNGHIAWSVSLGVQIIQCLRLIKLSATSADECSVVGCGTAQVLRAVTGTSTKFEVKKLNLSVKIKKKCGHK